MAWSGRGSAAVADMSKTATVAPSLSADFMSEGSVVLRHSEAVKSFGPHPEERRRKAARLEGWRLGCALLPSFETHRYAMLLRMRSGLVARPLRCHLQGRGGRPDSRWSGLPRRRRRKPAWRRAC